jgi:hypothetical protein
MPQPSFVPAKGQHNENGLFVGAPTWLCTLTVQVDLPANLSVNELEGIVAGSVAKDLYSLGLPANVSVKLTATQGNATLLNPTDQLAATPGQPSQGPSV